MLTPAALAVAMDVSVRQVQRWAAEGMPHTPIGTRGKRYDLTECQKWLRETYGCQSSRARPAGGTSASASIEGAFIEGSRQVRLRALPSSLRLKSAQASESDFRPSLVTQA